MAINDEVYVVEYNGILERSHCVKYKHSLVKQEDPDWVILWVKYGEK